MRKQIDERNRITIKWDYDGSKIRIETNVEQCADLLLNNGWYPVEHDKHGYLFIVPPETVSLHVDPKQSLNLLGEEVYEGHVHKSCVHHPDRERSAGCKKDTRSSGNKRNSSNKQKRYRADPRKGRSDDDTVHGRR